MFKAVRVPFSLKQSLLLLFLLGVSQAWAADAGSVPIDPLETARLYLVAGRADDAISLLTSSLSSVPDNAEAHSLLCRVYYQEERWDDAVRECEAAVRLAPNNSGYHLWLGRAYGQKADSMHSVWSYGLAKRVKIEFERAVQLDPNNVDAVSDLGEFYIDAPEIVGGDRSKAQATADSLQQRQPVQAYQLKALLAEKDKNYPLAESNFQAAIRASAHPADAWMALASFYSRRKQWDQALRAVHAGIDADAKSANPHSPALVEGAAILGRANMEPQLAIQLLKLYLASPNQSADSPAFHVHAQLSQLLDQQGDKAGARQQIAAATALARDYHPVSPRSLAMGQ